MTVIAEAGVTIDSALQMRRAGRALRRRLFKETDAYGRIPPVATLTGNAVPYNGKGDRFEFRIKFDDGRVRCYEVTVYGPGRSYRIWEI